MITPPTNKNSDPIQEAINNAWVAIYGEVIPENGGKPKDGDRIERIKDASPNGRDLYQGTDHLRLEYYNENGPPILIGDHTINNFDNDGGSYNFQNVTRTDIENLVKDKYAITFFHIPHPEDNGGATELGFLKDEGISSQMRWQIAFASSPKKQALNTFVNNNQLFWQGSTELEGVAHLVTWEVQDIFNDVKLFINGVNDNPQISQNDNPDISQIEAQDGLAAYALYDGTNDNIWQEKGQMSPYIFIWKGSDVDQGYHKIIEKHLLGLFQDQINSVNN